MDASPVGETAAEWHWTDNWRWDNVACVVSCCVGSSTIALATAGRIDPRFGLAACALLAAWCFMTFLSLATPR